MPKLEASTIEKYQNILQRDPQSQVFAPLAEAYREMKMHKEAEKVALEGLKKHPNFTSGMVVLAKIYRDLKRYDDALKLLTRACEASPDNLLAYHLLADAHLALKNPKEALKAYKRILFLNPKSDTAINAIKKLESLTADEYDDEVFAMSKLHESFLNETNTPAMGEEVSSKAPALENKDIPRGFERMLSLMDAFIVRNDLERAHELVLDCKQQFGEHPELLRRMKSLDLRAKNIEHDEDEEIAEELIPLSPRDKQKQQKKLDRLNIMLRNIESYRTHY